MAIHTALGKSRVRAGKAHAHPLRRRGAQRTRRAGIMGDTGRGAAQDIRRGTVVDGQRHGFQLRQFGAQALEAVRVRAAKAVDGLVGIANDKQAFPRRAPVTHQGALHGVDVLKLVHQQMGKAPVGGNVRLERVQQQVVQIARAQRLKPGLVGPHQGFIHARLGAAFAILDLRNGAQSGAGTHFS